MCGLIPNIARFKARSMEKILFLNVLTAPRCKQVVAVLGLMMDTMDIIKQEGHLCSTYSVGSHTPEAFQGQFTALVDSNTEHIEQDVQSVRHEYILLDEDYDMINGQVLIHT